MCKLAFVLGTVVLLVGAGDPQPAKPAVSDREKMLARAFGKDSDELRRAIKLLVRDKGLVLSAGQFTIEEDGRIKLSPCSIARFRFKAGDGLAQPYITIRSDWMLLTLDRPIQLPRELASRNLVSLELAEGLRLKVEEP